MKIDRVILVSNTNPLYYEFWNKLSFTYREKFNIIPTLIFFGKNEDIKKLNLSEKYGEILVIDSVHDNEPWIYTWALFYYTRFYLKDNCIIMGIDQIPLGTYFLRDCIENIDDYKYIMLIDDQYKLEHKYPKKWDEGGYSPSAYHIAKGSTFSEIYNFEDTFEEEINKLRNVKINTMWGNKWGMDEAYSSNTLMNYQPKEKIIGLSKSIDFLKRRIDCHRSNEIPYDINLMNNNFYIECHSVRPYANHKKYLDSLFDNIPNFK